MCRRVLHCGRDKRLTMDAALRGMCLARYGRRRETVGRSAILDNLDMHHCRDLLLFQIHHPRWEFVYQPKYAAYLTLIEPWWKILRSLALKGRRFDTWEEVVGAIAAATAYWQAHTHPFVLGRRRRHRILRSARSLALVTKVLRI